MLTIEPFVLFTILMCLPVNIGPGVVHIRYLISIGSNTTKTALNNLNGGDPNSRAFHPDSPAVFYSNIFE